MLSGSAIPPEFFRRVMMVSYRGRRTSHTNVNSVRITLLLVEQCRWRAFTVSLSCDEDRGLKFGNPKKIFGADHRRSSQVIGAGAWAPSGLPPLVREPRESLSVWVDPDRDLAPGSVPPL